MNACLYVHAFTYSLHMSLKGNMVFLQISLLHLHLKMLSAFYFTPLFRVHTTLFIRGRPVVKGGTRCCLSPNICPPRPTLWNGVPAVYDCVKQPWYRRARTPRSCENQRLVISCTGFYLTALPRLLQKALKLFDVVPFACRYSTNPSVT